MPLEAYSWEHLHLLAHPFPLVLAVVGAAAGLAGWLGGREDLERYALISLLLAGILVIPAYVTGLTAADVAADRTFVRESITQDHRTWATWSSLVLVSGGVFAGFSLLQPDDRRLRRFVFVAGAIGAALVVYAAYLGGGIRHGDPEDTDADALRGNPPDRREAGQALSGTPAGDRVPRKGPASYLDPASRLRGLLEGPPERHANLPQTPEPQRGKHHGKA